MQQQILKKKNEPKKQKFKGIQDTQLNLKNIDFDF